MVEAGTGTVGEPSAVGEIDARDCHLLPGQGRAGSCLPPAARRGGGARAGSSAETAGNAGKTYPAEILKADEVRALIRACSHRAPTGIRNRALIVVLYRAGLRVSEALALRPKDVDLEAGTVTVLHGKGDRRRTVGIDAGAGAVIERWAERRRGLGINGRAPLFCTLGGDPLQASYVRALRFAGKCGPHHGGSSVTSGGRSGALTTTFGPAQSYDAPAPSRTIS